MNYILKDENALYYECGFSCDNAVYLRFGSEAFFITDARYTNEALEYVKNAQVIEGDRRDLFVSVRETIANAKIQEIFFNPNEWSLQAYEKMRLGLEDITFTQMANLSMEKRIIKTAQEIEILDKAAYFGAKAFDRFAAFLAQEGRDLSEERLHFEAEFLLRDQGAFALSFSPIVALGKNAAKPHALPTSDCLVQNELVLFDAGIKYQRYCSDRTRTSQFTPEINFEKAQTFTNATQQKIYDTVRKAQEAGIKKAKAGIRAYEVDLACREVIDKAGYGAYFIHSTGHGVGLDIHELPVIGARSETLLQEGMVFTIEPGIYLGGEFGVRIEDTVVLSNNGAQILGSC
ncbi:MAG: aminopeptidase P family protein [Sulfurospirillum sp.]|nr:aminopeptidase P family protein [Sulfurospirillum sp.]